MPFSLTTFCITALRIATLGIMSHNTITISTVKAIIMTLCRIYFFDVMQAPLAVLSVIVPSVVLPNVIAPIFSAAADANFTDETKRSVFEIVKLFSVVFQ